LGVTLSVLGSELLRAEFKAMDRAKKNANVKAVKDFFDLPGGKSYHHRHSRMNSAVFVTDTEKGSSSAVKKGKSWSSIMNGLIHRTILFTILILCGLSIGQIEHWPWYDSIYYAIITLTTVGYGDIAPSTQKGRLFAIFFIPLSIAHGGQLLFGTAISSLLQKRREKYYTSLYTADTFNMGNLHEMDSNHNNLVNVQEFVEFMLVKMELVDKRLLRDLHDQFKALDVTKSGYLSKRDLQVMAKQKVRQAKAKHDKYEGKEEDK